MRHEYRRGQFLVRPKMSFTRLHERYTLGQIHAVLPNNRLSLEWFTPAGINANGQRVYEGFMGERHFAAIQDFKVFAEHEFLKAERYWEAQKWN